jgi:hypothetical protein
MAASSLNGQFIEVLTGDTVAILPNGVDYDDELKLVKISLANVRAPRTGNEKLGMADEPYATECKDRLCQLKVGKAAKVEVHYERDIPLPNGTEKRAFATLSVGKKPDIGELHVTSKSPSWTAQEEQVHINDKNELMVKLSQERMQMMQRIHAKIEEKGKTDAAAFKKSSKKQKLFNYDKKQTTLSSFFTTNKNTNTFNVAAKTIAATNDTDAGKENMNHDNRSSAILTSAVKIIYSKIITMADFPSHVPLTNITNSPMHYQCDHQNNDLINLPSWINGTWSTT